MTDAAWFLKRVTVSAFLVGWLWNGQPGEEASVYLIALSLILLTGWVRDVRRAAR